MKCSKKIDIATIPKTETPLQIEQEKLDIDQNTSKKI
jgi:hypothetical protein